MKIYEANREKFGRSVKVNTDNDFYWLDPRPSQKLYNHSPDGFEWGYGGSGPAQLSLSILLDLLGEDHKEAALKFYQDFKFDIVAGFAKDGFVLPSDLIFIWIKALEERTT